MESSHFMGGASTFITLNEYKQKELKKNIVETTLPIPIFIWEIGDILYYNVGSFK